MKRSFFDRKKREIVILAPNTSDDDIELTYNYETGKLLVDIKATELTLKLKENFLFPMSNTEVLDGELKNGVLKLKVIDADD